MIIAEEYRKAVLDDLEKILNAQDDDWAEKIIMRAQAYGVIENDASYIELFGEK